MRIPRIYEQNLAKMLEQHLASSSSSSFQSTSLQPSSNLCSLELPCSVTLNEYGAGHISRVLRLKVGAKIRLFDGLGHEYLASLTQVGKTTVAQLQEYIDNSLAKESPLQIELLQVISRGDRMDFTIQKAVELGISSIVPLTSERCGVKLDGDRALKKIDSYQKIAIAACEQCGRSFVPQVKPLTSIKALLKQYQEQNKKLLTHDRNDIFQDQDGFINLTLDPKAPHKLSSLPKTYKYRLLIGPEGGFTDEEINFARASGFTGINLGPRILRTETAALVTLSILGSCFGDL